ncbi:MFS transporter [Radicibacter daui]|uniref:MFS transporter n=1 Tax=Radicibacter daui TaxID=3064829 RepID=UPI00404699A3
MISQGLDAGAVRRKIHLLFAIQLVSMGAMEMSGPFWPVHLRSLAASDELFAFASTAVYVGPMLGVMLTSSFWGRVGDRFGHRAMMIRALLGLALTQFALAWSADVWLILLLRFVQGACAGYIAPAQAYGVAIEAPERRARLFAYLQASTNLGSLGGALLGGIILDHGAFLWINLAAAALCAVSALAVWRLLPPLAPGRSGTVPLRREEERKQAAGAGAGGTLSAVLPLLAILGTLLLARMVTQSPFSLYVLTVFRSPNWVTGLCYGLVALGVVVSARWWAIHFEGRSRGEMLGRMGLVIAACAAVTLLAAITRSVVVFTALYFLWGLLLGATTPVLTGLVSRAAGEGRQGQVLGLAQATSQFASIAGIALGGWFAQAAGLSKTYFLVAFVYVLALVLTLMVRAGSGRRAAAIDPLESHKS